jgi:anaerobic selenocysteine-containing dehydrogenase
MCGLEIKHDGEKILSIKGDKKDVFSQGHICPKATALQDLHEDPDRLRVPMERTENGWKEISWTQALDKAASGIQKIQQQHGKNALGVYIGNPNAHNLGGMLTMHEVLGAMKTHNRFSAVSVDHLPHLIVAHHLFGHQLRIAVPDINHTQHILIIGANPIASNGSIMTVANVKQKLKDIQKRGGKVVVIDPRHTETAKISDQHHFIRPGTDIFLLLAMLNEIYAQGFDKQSHASQLTPEFDQIKQLAKDYTAEKVAAITGISAQEIKTLVKEFCEAPSSVCYGRMGVSVQEFGLLSQYLIMLINLVTGRLDTKGGVMFSSPAVDVIKNSGRGNLGRRRSRLKGLPNFHGEFPVAAMSDEMLVPGEGQIKGFFTMAGNPVLSTPNGKKLEGALENLDFMVCVDYYLNETTRHANIILPPVSPLEREHYDLTYHGVAVHNSAKYAPALFEKQANAKHDWQIFIELAKRLDTKPKLKTRISRALTSWFGPSFLLNAGLKAGPYKGLSLKTLKKNPHGMDLGPMVSQLPSALKTKDKKIHLHMSFYLADLERVAIKFNEESAKEKSIILIGRRHLRSNNSWLHNSKRLVKGKSRCTLMIHPELASAQHIEQGDLVKITSRVGSIEVEAEITSEIMPGVVSIPHGWGHNRKGTRQRIANNHAGVSANDITDEQLIDELSGNAAVNGVPVVLENAMPKEMLQKRAQKRIEEEEAELEMATT